MSYRTIALQTLQNTAEKLDGAGFDVDEGAESVTIHTSAGLYLLNYHGTVDQIWLSSPKTGAHHFVYENEKWRSTRHPVFLDDVLKAELLS